MQRSKFLSLLSYILIPTITVYGKRATLLQEYMNTSNKQKQLIREIYNKGKQYGLEKTFVVIAWKESSFGEEMANSYGEWSGGIFGNSYKHASSRVYNVRNPSPTQIAITEKRIKDDIDFAMEDAYEHLALGIKKFDNDWHSIWAFYNGGYKYWDGQDAQRYADDFVKKMRIINKVGIL